MLATLVIGLREGLEAALIVGIIAAFLRNNGKRLAPMWIGVTLAVALSIAVGIALRLVEQGLPQAKQEAMESVIGAIAIVFVTGMIVWMNTHARGMKRDLEADAAEALSQGGAHSLAVMAFLAVLKEGFETSVFLLATFSAAQSARLAASGAVIGVLIAVGIGWGIYAGGVRINLARFFRVTGAFLILVAAGLTVTMLRTAHEAGWITAGQQHTVDLNWLVRPGTVQSALITGVLGIPADPRLIEVIGWFAYLIPVALYVYWPARRRPTGVAAARVQFGAAAGLVAAALILVVAYPAPQPPTPTSVTLVSTSGGSSQAVGTARLQSDAGKLALAVSVDGSASTSIPLAKDASTRDVHNGVTAKAWVSQVTDPDTSGPETVTLDQLAALAGGRIPIGISPQEQPGPFAVERATVSTATVWVSHGMLLDAAETVKTIATISGGGLDTPRTISVAGSGSDGWAVSADDATRVASAANRMVDRESERTLWAIELPIVLGLAALVCACAGGRTWWRYRQTLLGQPAPASFPVASNTPAMRRVTDGPSRSDIYAAH